MGENHPHCNLLVDLDRKPIGGLTAPEDERCTIHAQLLSPGLIAIEKFAQSS